MSLGDAMLSTVLEQVSKRILEKPEEGKRLTTEDILLLYMDMAYSELRDIKEELREINKRIDDANRRIGETNKRIDNMHHELSRKIDDTNRRIDKLYELLSRGCAPSSGPAGG